MEPKPVMVVICPSCGTHITMQDGMDDPGPTTQALRVRNFTHESLDRLIAVVREARRATGYSYEAGEYPPGMSKEVESFFTPDGGLLNLLDFAQKIVNFANVDKVIPNIVLFKLLAGCFGVEMEQE